MRTAGKMRRPPRRRPCANGMYVVGSALPQSAWCALAAAVNRCSPSKKTGTRIAWSAGCVLPRYGSLCRKASPSREVGVEVGHRLGQVLHAEHVHRQALGGGEQPVVAGDERAREVARHVEDRRAAGAQQRVLHLAHDAVEAVGDHRQQDGIEELMRVTSLVRRRPRPARRPSGSTSMQVVARLGDARARARVDDDGRRRLADDRRALDLGAGAAASRRRSAARRRAPWPAEVAPARVLRRLRLASPLACAPRSDLGLGQLRRSRAPSRSGTRVLARLAHREDALVDVVERLHERRRRPPARASATPAAAPSSSHTWPR